MGIKIEISAENAAELDVLLGGLGYARRDVNQAETAWQNYKAEDAEQSIIQEMISKGAVEIAESPAAVVEHQPEPKKRGRRTKAETEAEKPAADPEIEANTPKPPDRPHWSAPAEISKQDAADEAREAAMSTKGVTRDDLRQVVGAYTKIVGFAEVRTMVPKLLGSAVNDVPEDKIPWAIGKIQDAIKGDVYVGEDETEEAPKTVDPNIIEPVLATRSEVADAFKAYAKKFDGQCEDLSIAKHTLQDGPALLKKLFGDHVTQIKHIPQSPEAYGYAVTAINKAIEEDPFNRGVHR